MTTVARLTADLTANTASFEQGMQRASKELLSFRNIAKVTFESELFKGAFDKAVEGLKELTVGQAESIIRTQQQAQSIGASLTEFEALSDVAKNAGVEQEALTKAMGNTEKALEKAASGSKEQEIAFRALGLSVHQLIGLSPDQQFEKIATSLSKVQNPTERAALAFTIFGRDGTEVNKMLVDFGGNLEEARSFQQKFNLAVSDLDATKVNQAATEVDKVKEAFGGLGNTFVVYFAPLVKEVAKDLLDAGVDGQSFGNAVRKGAEYGAEGVDFLRQTTLGLGALFLQLEADIDNVVADGADKLASLSRFLDEIPLLGKNNAGSTDYYEKLAQSAREDAAQLAQGIAEANNEAEHFQTTMEKLDAVQRQAGEDAAKTVKTQGKGYKDQLTLLNAINGAMERQASLLKSIGVDPHYKQDLRDLRLLYNAHVISLSQYGAALDKLNFKMLESDKTMEGGFARGMIKLRDEFTDVGSLVQKTMVDGFQNAEDAIVSFAQTGKLKLSDFFSSIEADLIRVAVRAEITGPLATMLFGMPGSSGGLLSSIFPTLSLPSYGTGTSYVPQDMVARVHKGEEIVPARLSAGLMGGGIEVNVINNHPSAQISARETPGSGGASIEVTVDDLMAKVLTNSRSKTAGVLSKLGVRPPLTSR